MSTNYDTERSRVPGHVTRITETFFSELPATAQFSRWARKVLGKSRDSMSRDISHAVTTQLETEIRKMEEQGKPVGDMSHLKLSYNWISPEAVDGVWMKGFITGEGYSRNTEIFDVPPSRTTTAEEVEAENRAREERKAVEDEGEDGIKDWEVVDVDDVEYCVI
ncbi:hypothetical protein B9479_008263 [Cryptococcus floricola]|uniref:Uncharacterized protein n=1 Tax=Cryptococcus floricola TaxID=2591691 RepID=A0A5D3AI17_9TREE|nr:hypothetical protein B9479_008263 [Cryptococcus floricola]